MILKRKKLAIKSSRSHFKSSCFIKTFAEWPLIFPPNLIVGHDVVVHLVIDEGVVEVHVGCLVLVCREVTVEWESEGRRVVEIAAAAADSAGDGVVEAGEALGRGCSVRHQHKEELHGIAANAASGQHQSRGESAVGFGHVQDEFLAAIVSRHQVLVQLVVSGAVVDEPREVSGLAFEEVVAGLQVDHEALELPEVVAVLVDVQNLAEAVVLGSDEDGERRLLFLIGVRLDLHGERQVVQSRHGDLEFVLRLDVFFRLNRHVDGVGDISCEQVEICQKLVNLDALELHAIECEIGFRVGRHLRHEGFVEENDALVEDIKHGITKGRLEELQHAVE